MTTTDRMSNLDSRREITDRLGETVILGNSVGSGVLDSDAIIVAADFGSKSDVTSEMDMDASFILNAVNGSFGIWAVFLNVMATSALAGVGASIRAARMIASAVAALSFGTNGGGLINVRSFTSTTGYTPTAGTVSIVVECIGGGGGGAGAAATAAGQSSLGSGGASGSYAIARMTSGFSGQTITIGAGGAGGVGGNNGSAGGATSLGTKLIAGGGNGGNTVPASAATVLARYGGEPNGASGSDSLFAASGRLGGTAYLLNNLLSGGYGAPTIFGAGGVGGEISGAGGTSGGAPAGFGAGGGGAVNGPSQSARDGNAGSSGICIVWEYNT
ncbi:MAG: hypothetical protein E6Q24_14675 [Chitinophagaceae bacterium]|nr:MAG: hypothetical protein E6Q24_14675 [Chitinophagaceae bacterium]